MEQTSLDLRFMVPELRSLEGGIIRKIYQHKRQFIFDIYKNGPFLLYFDSSSIFLASQKSFSSEIPPSFCMLLRKHLEGKKILSIEQYSFDRILLVKTAEKTLIIELFGSGNVILCDKDLNIIMPLESRTWAARAIKPRMKYELPPQHLDPSEAKHIVLEDVFANSGKKVGTLLATDLGLGKTYSDEVCHMSGVEKSHLARDMGSREISAINKSLHNIFKAKPSPAIYQDIVSPFQLKTRPEPSGKTHSLSEAFETLFSREQEKADTPKKQDSARLERQLQKQKEAIEKWEKEETDSRKTAEALYANYADIQGILDTIRDKSLTWDEKKYIISKNRVFKELLIKEGAIKIGLGEVEINFDFRRTIEKNAEKYFELAKRARRKREAIGKILSEKPEKESKRKLERLLTEKPWYEKFKWFRASDNTLVIAGRSADQNEDLIKRHTTANDFVCHADIRGGSFSVAKTEGRDISDQIKKETAEFAASNSKAWVQGMGTIDVHCVSGKNVIKTAGLPKGTFEFRGPKQNLKRIRVELAVGVLIVEDTAKIISGPLSAIESETENFVVLTPGTKDAKDLAIEIKKRLAANANHDDRDLIDKIPNHEIESIIPSRVGEIKG